MKWFNIKSALLLAAAAFTFAACTDDDNADKKTSLSGAQVYFSTAATSSFSLDDDQTTITVEVSRANTSEAVTVPLTAEDLSEGGIFTLPTSVSFAAGQDVAEVTVAINRDESVFEADVDYQFVLTIDDNYTTPYGAATNTFTVTYAPWSEWAVYGSGVYTYTQFWSGDDDECPVYYRYSLADSNKAQFKFGDEFLFYGVDFIVDIDLSTNYLSVPVTFTGYNHSSYGYVYVADLNAYTGGDSYTGASYFDPESGTFYFYVIYYVSAGYFGYGYETFQLSGFASYAASYTYEGRFTSTDDVNYAVGTITLDEGVSYAKYAVVADGTDLDGVVAGIIDGSTEAETITESGRVAVELSASGTYHMVIVTFDANGEAKQSSTSEFKFKLPNEAEWEWTSNIYTGTYTYSLVFSGDDPDLTLTRDEADPTRWTISNWCYGVDFCFTYNEETGEVLVDDQKTGYVHSSYGDVYVCDLVTYTGSTSNGASYFDDGVFYFNVIYYCSAGYFGYGYETFQVSAAVAAAKANKAKASATKSMSVVNFGQPIAGKKFIKNTPILKRSL